MTTLTINGRSVTFDAPDDMPLLWVLRDVLGMTGTKFGCGIAQCGACTVHLDGKPVRSCLLPIGAIGDPRPSPRSRASAPAEAGAKVQKAWLDLEVIQCGYCQSGQIMSAAALLADDAATRRRRYRRRDGREYLPLRHLCPHPRGDQARRGRSLGRRRCTDQKILRMSPSRRVLLKGGLAAGFPPRLPPSGARRERAGASARYDRRQVRAERFHPHRSLRQDHSGHAAGRDGAGRLYGDPDDSRRRARRRFRQS